MADEDKETSRYGKWGSLSIGLLVVGVGVVFLLDNFGMRLPFYRPHNWWALFILVGAVPLLLQAVEQYQRNGGKLDRKLLCLLLSAAGPILVATMFLAELSWDLWWPLFVIYGGLWVMVGGRKKRTDT